MLKIQTWTENEILRKISDEIKQSELNTYIKIGKEMIKYIKNPENRWVWLARPQIWYNKRLIVVSMLKTWEDENYPTIMMINPEILELSKEYDIQEEWCLSVPEKYWKVKRSTKIKISFTDEKKTKKILYLTWPRARIVQHEIDHLDWILFTDKII